MEPAGNDDSKAIEINASQRAILSVLFTDDGKQVMSGGEEAMLRRWRVDGREVGKPVRVEGGEIYAAALSPDRKWWVGGLKPPHSGSDAGGNVRVWDAKTLEKALDVKGHSNSVFSVHVSPDSMKFVTGSSDKTACIWSLTTGERLVGPLQHEGAVVAVCFSPTGDRIATATAQNPEAKSIRIYDSDHGQQLLDIPFRIGKFLGTPLAWSTDGHQLFAASWCEVKCFDASSGSLVSHWTVPEGGGPASIILSRNQKFAIIATNKSLFFWDLSTYTQIGAALQHSSGVRSVALSFDEDYVATGENDGKVTLRSIRDILPLSYLTVKVGPFNIILGSAARSKTFQSTLVLLYTLPLMFISDAAFGSWMECDFTRVEELLEEEILRPSSSLHHACALAQRSVVRTRLKQWDNAVADAKKSIKAQRTVIGHIATAMAIAHTGDTTYEQAMRAFDLAFACSLQSENNYLLLIKAIILFECGKHEDAVARVEELIDVVDDQNPLFITIRAQMYFLLGNLSMKGSNNKRAVELFKRAQEAVPFQKDPRLVFVSLLFGWDFDRLALTIQLQLWKAMYAAGHVEVVNSLFTMAETLGEEKLTSDLTDDWSPDLIRRCLEAFEHNGDVALKSQDLTGAIMHYSTALSLNPVDPVGLVVKRSKARAMLGEWEDALKDADEAVKTDPANPLGYERQHAALHGLERYDDALHAFSRMLSFIERSADADVHQLGKKYVSPFESEKSIDNAVHTVCKMSPLVLIDVKTGRLCDRLERTRTFKSESKFKELVSSMTEKLDTPRIHRIVEEYFQYVTLSHVWEGKEPSFQDVDIAGSIWKLDSSLLVEKLRKFCEVVQANGYCWAWSDTCCIDKTISTVLNQSLMMMYKWYEASASTFVYLGDVESPSAPGDLLRSIWMTRAWTSEELLAARVVRFYARDWKPYLGDNRSNHKESPEIMQELADAIGIARKTIVTFTPDQLTVREKLRLASTRNATVEEDIAYALIGMFKSDIIPRYGEGDAALGHLLEEIVARSGEVTVLDWAGQPSSYNSCLPASIRVYSRPPVASLSIEDTEMNVRVETLKRTLSQTEAIQFHVSVARLPPARFANRRLYLPCLVLAVKKLSIQYIKNGQNNHYRARVSGIHSVEFETSDILPLNEPRRLILVHPWLRALQDPLRGFRWGSSEDDEDDSGSDLDSETGSAASSSSPVDSDVAMDDYTRALRLVARLQQPFHALLLEQQPNGEFKRVATEHEIILPGLDSERRINLGRDIRIEVVEIL